MCVFCVKRRSPQFQLSDTCDFCHGTKAENKNTGKAEELINCRDCGRSGHPTCLKFSQNILISAKRHGWQCIECKSCAVCGTSENDAKLLFCDDCDRGFHCYCLIPALLNPPEDEWSCEQCQREFGDKASNPLRR
uniref:PHD-type domain-containing protein n=1 Tax=Panagrolaimus davidi TaxID=227884 RepID=A0A914PRC5_9BILA